MAEGNGNNQKVVVHRMGSRAGHETRLPVHPLLAITKSVLPEIEGARDVHIFAVADSDKVAIANEVLSAIKSAGEISEASVSHILSAVCAKYGITREQVAESLRVKLIEDRFKAETFAADAEILASAAEVVLLVEPRKPSEETIGKIIDVFAKIAALPMNWYSPRAGLIFDPDSSQRLKQFIRNHLSVNEDGASYILRETKRMFDVDYPNLRRIMYDVLEGTMEVAKGDMINKGEIRFSDTNILQKSDYLEDEYPFNFKPGKEQEVRERVLKVLLDVRLNVFSKIFNQCLDIYVRDIVAKFGFFEPTETAVVQSSAPIAQGG